MSHLDRRKIIICSEFGEMKRIMSVIWGSLVGFINSCIIIGFQSFAVNPMSIPTACVSLMLSLA
jgi:hypothetical protein